MESSSNRSLIQTPPYLRAFCGKKTRILGPRDRNCTTEGSFGEIICAIINNRSGTFLVSYR